MKLLAELQKQIAALGELRRAWFTSFNADIEFIEAYVLPVALGANTPRNRIEYEQLQQELTARSIDFRVFCDPRFLETHRVKRTCIPVHGIRAQRARDRFSEHSLFHPKVIYLEDKDGRCVIGAGSANLTVSGWGRNLEVFQFHDVKDVANYREIRAFFENVCEAADIPCPLVDRPDLPRVNERWRFVHSYQQKSFPEQLFPEAGDVDMAVWTPYLPHDLTAFLEKLAFSGRTRKLRVHVVADRSVGYVRTPWSERLSSLQEEGSVTFREHPVAQDERLELCHAKIWKVGDQLALGSWNFTGPGSNSLRDEKGRWHKDNNVEAGFIVEDSNDWRLMCGAVLKLSSEDCATSEQLDKDGLKVMGLPPFDLHICFDWHKQTYQFMGAWLDGAPCTDYKVELPGVEIPVPLHWSDDGALVSQQGIDVDEKALLHDRVFKVLRGEQEVHRGMVQELQAGSRRAQHFYSLKDLFDAWVQNDDVKELNTLSFRSSMDTDMFVDDDRVGFPGEIVGTHGEGATGSPITYFRLFRSTQAFQRKLQALSSLQELDQLVFTLPGCLLELVNKVALELVVPGRGVFHWFLVNEVRWLRESALGQRAALIACKDQSRSSYEPVPESRWKVLRLPATPAPDVLESYLNHVRKQWGQCV